MSNQKIINFMGFLIMFLTIVVGIHAYVYWHVWQILPISPLWKTMILSLFTLSFSCLFLYLSPAQDRLPMPISRMIYETGTSWIIILLYLFIVFLLLDAGRLCHLVPKTLLHHSLAGTLGITLLMSVVFFCGNVHYHHKQLKTLDLTSKKVVSGRKLLFVSDLHVGYHNPRTELSRWVDLINAEKPDAVIIGGDIIDGNIRPLQEEQAWEEFLRIDAPVFACLGNHEYLAGKEASEQFYRQSDIQLLEDSVATYGSFCIIGRDDRTNKDRKPLSALMRHADRSKFTIVVDHQPYNLEEAADSHVDFQLSGHTHHGQVWPLNWITDAVYECAYGAYKKSGTDYYVSSGLGIWGGKFRIGTGSEYVIIRFN